MAKMTVQVAITEKKKKSQQCVIRKLLPRAEQSDCGCIFSPVFRFYKALNTMTFVPDRID